MKKKTAIIAISIILVVCIGIGLVFISKDNQEASTETSETQTESEITEITPTPEVESTPTPEPSESEEPQMDSNANSGSYNTSISTEDTTYCDFTPIDEITLYSKVDGSMYDNPNLHEGALVNGGGFSVNESITFNYKTTYNDVEYYVIKNEAGLVLMVRADQLSETPVEVSVEAEQPADTQGSSGASTSGNSSNGGVYGDINPNQPAGSLAAKMTDEQLAVYIKRLQDAGWTQQQIDDRLYSNSNGTGTNYVDGGDGYRDPSTYTEEELEILKKAAGMTTH